MGFLIAWVLVRYEFPRKRLFDALIDLPFALPTAVAGLVYSNLYVPNSSLGEYECLSDAERAAVAAALEPLALLLAEDPA